jgi:hypothetical protein
MGGGPGDEGLGRAIWATGDIIQDTLDRQDVSDVHAKLAQAQGDWTVHLQERAQAAQPGDPTFARKFNEDFGGYLAKIEEGISTNAGRLAFRRGAANLSSHFVEKAGVFQAASMGAKAKQDYLVSLDAYRNTLLSDPTQFTATLKAALDSISDPAGPFARMSAADREKLFIQTRKELALSAVDGLIRNGAAELAKRQLMDGKWDEYLDADKKSALIEHADVGIRMKDTAAERARLLAERERKDAQEATMSGFLARVVDPKGQGGALSDQEILADRTLDSSHKQHLIDYKMRRARELRDRGENRSNPVEVRRLMQETHGIGNQTQVYNTSNWDESYRTGKLSTAEWMLGRREVEQLRDGNTSGFQKDLQSARTAVNTALTRSVMGQVQPEVAADAAYRFSRDLEKAVERKRTANEDPRVLLDPNSKEYMLSPTRIQSYMMSPGEAVRAEADRLKREGRGTVGDAAPRAGTVQDGYRFKGGNPADRKNWEKL